jgi:hypothetical protein
MRPVLPEENRPSSCRENPKRLPVKQVRGVVSDPGHVFRFDPFPLFSDGSISDVSEAVCSKKIFLVVKMGRISVGHA